MAMLSQLLLTAQLSLGQIPSMAIRGLASVRKLQSTLKGVIRWPIQGNLPLAELTRPGEASLGGERWTL